MTRRRGVVAALVLAALSGGAAWAFWSGDTTSGSGGAAAAANVGAGATPTANASGSSVTVSWSASTLSTGTAVDGYQVKRYDAGTLTPQAVLTACDGTVTATSCIETGVPEGRWVYTVTPLFATSWRGAESATSPPVWVDVTPPTNSISLDPVSGGSSRTGSTVYYRGVATGSFRLTNAVGDTGSGAASSSTAALAGPATGWTHSPSTVSTPAGGPFQSGLFSWSSATTSSPTTTVTGRDVVGNTDDDVLTFVDDSTEPENGSVGATGLGGTDDAYSQVTGLSIAFAKGTDAGSGVSSTGATLWRASAPLSSTGGANGTCGTWSGYTQIGSTEPASPAAFTATTNTCYRFRYDVLDNVGNQTSYTSIDTKVDTSAPTGTPTRSFGNFANTSNTTNNIYYRSTADSGSFTVTGAGGTDTGSGIAGHQMPTLGAGWTATEDSSSVTTYSWSAAGAAAGTGYTVRAVNHAGKPSTNASTAFALVADNTAPTSGSISYSNTTTTATSVAVTLTNGSDSGSGLGTRTLERADAALSGTTCGSFGAFAEIASGPASPYSDTGLARDTCYMYRLVIPDKVGNSVTRTSASVVKVQSYNTAVRTTTGLASHWRLGETTTSYDTLTDPPGTLLHNHTGEIDSAWTKSTVAGAADMVLEGGRMRKSGNNVLARYWTSAVPAAAGYAVEADVYVATRLTDDWIGVVGRLDPAVQNGTYYAAGYDEPTQAWTLYRVVNGVRTTLSTPYGQSLTPGSSYHLSLDMAGSTIRLLVDGVQRVSATDANISAAGRGGIQQGNGTTSVDVTAAAGMHLDNVRVTPPLADGWGTNHSSYAEGPTLGEAGAISGDADTAVRFNGVNQYSRVARQIAGDFSIELWFKSTQGIGTTTSWTGGAGLVDADVAGVANDFGISLRSDGRILAGTGNPDSSILSSSSGLNDGAWHHVVFTRTQTSGTRFLYVDGAQVGTSTGGTGSLSGSATIDFGRISTGGNYYAGSLDEVAVYSAALSGATVTAHYAARQ